MVASVQYTQIDSHLQFHSLLPTNGEILLLFFFLYLINYYYLIKDKKNIFQKLKLSKTSGSLVKSVKQLPTSDPIGFPPLSLLHLRARTRPERLLDVYGGHLWN